MVVLTVNRIAEPLAAVTVAVVTGTAGHDTTHVPVGSESGLTEYAESSVNRTDLHTVAEPLLRRKIGLLAPTELERVEDAMRLTLGLRHRTVRETRWWARGWVRTSDPSLVRRPRLSGVQAPSPPERCADAGLSRSPASGTRTGGR